MSYDPPGGALGHAVASRFGEDPQNVLEADLVRFETLMEAGPPSAPGGSPRGGDLER